MWNWNGKNYHAEKIAQNRSPRIILRRQWVKGHQITQRDDQASQTRLPHLTERVRQLSEKESWGYGRSPQREDRPWASQS